MEIHMLERAPIRKTLILETDWCRATQSRASSAEQEGHTRYTNVCPTDSAKAPSKSLLSFLSHSGEGA